MQKLEKSNTGCVCYRGDALKTIGLLSHLKICGAGRSLPPCLEWGRKIKECNIEWVLGIALLVVVGVCGVQLLTGIN